MDMEVAILAGGPATKLRDFTRNQPKSMLKIQGETFREYQLELLRRGGIKNIVFCIGHIGEQVGRYFGNGRQYGVDIEYSVEDKRLSIAETLAQLEGNIPLFFIGKERSASEILSEQVERPNQDNPEMINNLHQIKEIGLEMRRYLEKGQVNMLGELPHVYWETKKKHSQRISDLFVDECYEVARKNGTASGKLVGAGGGGFFS